MLMVQIDKLFEVAKNCLLALEQDVHHCKLNRCVVLHFINHQDDEYTGFLPIGMAIFGPLADIFPLQWIMIGSGIALIIIAGRTYFNWRLKAI